ncbi:MAG: dihydrodipicolinate synthase family protein [Granulosicoccus sp.]
MITTTSDPTAVGTEHPLSGIHAATLCPMDSTGNVLVDELALHISHVATSPGIRGLLINGHAGEGALLNMNERQLVLECVKASAPEGCHVCAGVTGESTAAAVETAVQAAENGANSILVFPPNAWALGHDANMALEHHQAIANASGLPMVLYRAPLASAKQSYSIETLLTLIEIDAVTAIKEGSWEVSAYDEARRAVMFTRPDVAVLGSGDEHLMTCYSIGSAGSQVSLAAIVPGLIVSLFDSMQAGDLATARELHDLVYPLSEAIYRKVPSYMATARLKSCLNVLGQFSEDVVKAPMLGCGVDERDALHILLQRGEYDSYL